MKSIKIDRIMETTYEDGTSWIEYTTPQGYFGYEITECYKQGNEEQLEKEVNNDKVKYKELLNKKHISKCSRYLAEIIDECRQSDNEMWFVDEEDLKKYLETNNEEIIEKFLEKISEEIDMLGIENYVMTYDSGCLITVFGGVITQFLFGGEL